MSIVALLLPFIRYSPEQDINTEVTDPDAILMLGVDILPSELPRDASEHFGTALLPLLPPLLHSVDEKDLPAELQRACIAAHGELRPKWAYIARLREQLSAAAVTSNKMADNIDSGDASSPIASQRTVAFIDLQGHLFDSGLINTVLDLIEQHYDTIAFDITNCDVRPNRGSTTVPSKILLQLRGDDEQVRRVTASIKRLVEASPKAEATFNEVIKTGGSSGGAAQVVGGRPIQRLLLLGSGRVARPVIKLFDQDRHGGAVHVTIASDDAAQANDLMSYMTNSHNINMKRNIKCMQYLEY